MLTWSSCVHVFIRGRSRVLHVSPVLRKLAEIFAHNADEEVEQCGAFLLGEVRERDPKDVVGDQVSSLEDSFVGGSQVMFDPPTPAGRRSIRPWAASRLASVPNA